MAIPTTFTIGSRSPSTHTSFCKGDWDRKHAGANHELNDIAPVKLDHQRIDDAIEYVSGLVEYRADGV